MSDALRPITPVAATASAGEDDWRATALRFRGQRQVLIASNIANADTPHFKARDMSFSAALEDAARSRPATSIATTSLQHLTPTLAAPRSTVEFAQFARPAQDNLDGNTVDIEQEQASFAQNAILHQLAIASLDDEVKEFRQASAAPTR